MHEEYLISDMMTHTHTELDSVSRSFCLANEWCGPLNTETIVFMSPRGCGDRLDSSLLSFPPETLSHFQLSI